MELLSKILRKENLVMAYENVIRNKGSCGVDGIGVEALKPFLQEHWTKLKEELLNSTYHPCAILG